jgi:hypothetical protein
MLSKAFIVLSLLVATAPSAFAENLQLPQEIFASKFVQTLIKPALVLKKVDTSSPPQARNFVPDCSNNPVIGFQPDTSFCGFEFNMLYGWYADPVLVLTIKGYVAKSKIARGGLTDKDLIVTETTIGTPLPTGLE